MKSNYEVSSSWIVGYNRIVIDHKTLDAIEKSYGVELNRNHIKTLISGCTCAFLHVVSDDIGVIGDKKPFGIVEWGDGSTMAEELIVFHKDKWVTFVLSIRVCLPSFISRGRNISRCLVVREIL